MVDFSRGILAVLSRDEVDMLILVARISTVWTNNKIWTGGKVTYARISSPPFLFSPSSSLREEWGGHIPRSTLLHGSASQRSLPSLTTPHERYDFLFHFTNEASLLDFE